MIHTGAVAFVDTTDTSVAKGDIVTYQLPNGQMVTHRVKEETADGYIFQGDANEAADAHVITGSQIIGTYKFQIPKLGFLIGRLGKKGLFLVLEWYRTDPGTCGQYLKEGYLEEEKIEKKKGEQSLYCYGICGKGTYE